jgi:hypothetical protein
MQQKLTQISLSPALAGDGKLPAVLATPGNPVYERVMDAVDRQDIGLTTLNKRMILDAHSVITGTVRLINNELCYEYSPVRPPRDRPDQWGILCFSGNLNRPYQHPFCPDCVFFDSDNNKAAKINVNQRIAAILADRVSV